MEQHLFILRMVSIFSIIGAAILMLNIADLHAAATIPRKNRPCDAIGTKYHCCSDLARDCQPHSSQSDKAKVWCTKLQSCKDIITKKINSKGSKGTLFLPEEREDGEVNTIFFRMDLISVKDLRHDGALTLAARISVSWINDQFRWDERRKGCNIKTVNNYNYMFWLSGCVKN